LKTIQQNADKTQAADEVSNWLKQLAGKSVESESKDVLKDIFTSQTLKE